MKPTVMKFTVQAWTMTRKKTRPSFHLGALGMLFSVSDRVSGPKLSEQDRLDAVYPYRLELAAIGVPAGRYRLVPSGGESGGLALEWAADLGGRVWQTQTGKAGHRLVTDLTEYERLRWEELVAQGGLALEFGALA